MQVKTFKQWTADNADMLEELEATPTICDVCDGDGRHECDCGDMHHCRNCHGSGKLNTNIAQDLYHKYLSGDAERIKRWGKEPIHA